MFRIGEFAKLNMVSIKTLRFYDQKNILKPSFVDEDTGYRYYSADQMMTLNRIVSLKYLGFSLDEIKLIIGKSTEVSDMIDLLKWKEAEISSKIKDENMRLSRIKYYLNVYKQEENFMKSEIVLKKGKDILVATLRDIIPEYSQQGHLWEELVSHIEKHGAKILSPCMVIYHEEGYKESEVDAEVIEPIDKEIPATDRIEVKKLIPYENLATIVHKGSYQNLYMSYGEIMKWIKRNDYEIIDSSRELYIKGEWNSDSIDEYVTEIQIPVKKK